MLYLFFFYASSSSLPAIPAQRPQRAGNEQDRRDKPDKTRGVRAELDAPAETARAAIRNAAPYARTPAELVPAVRSHTAARAI